MLEPPLRSPLAARSYQNIMGDRDRSRSPTRNGKSTGIAQRWNEKGFGFIKPDDGGEDLFCHYSNIVDGNALEQGAAVEFVKVYDERKGKDRAEEMQGKVSGIAQRWNEKGFGFIKPDDGGEDLFCHFSNIEDGNALARDSKVYFVKVFDETKGKERAEQVVGGIQEDRNGGGGGGYGGGGYGGGGYGGGGYGGGKGGKGGGYGGGGYGGGRW